MDLLQTPTVSAVVIARNEEMNIASCLESLRAQTAATLLEIIVVDGNSLDRTPALVEQAAEQDDRVTLVREGPNTDGGPAFARNLGAARATGDYILFMNADVEVPRDYVAALVSFARERGVQAAAGLRWNRPGSVVSELMNVHYMLNYNGSPATLDDPVFLSGDAVLIDRGVFKRIGGYSTGFPAGEDVDLGLRLRAAGFRTAYNPDLVISHHGKHYSSVRNWVSQIAWYARGAAALAAAHPARRDLEKKGLRRNVLMPMTGAGALTAAIVALAAAGYGLEAALTVATGAALGAARYAMSVRRINTVSSSVELPSPLSRRARAIYPLFRTARYALLSGLTWWRMRSFGRPAGKVKREQSL